MSAKPSVQLTVNGVLVGLVQVQDRITVGPVEIWTAGHELRFRGTVTLPDTGDTADVQLARFTLALESAVAAAVETTVKVRVTGWTRSAAAGNQVGSAVHSSWSTFTLLQGDVQRQRGQAALNAVLDGPDERLGELYEVYLLGLRAMDTVAPAVGLWAFTTVLEEESSRPSRPNLQHVSDLAAELRNQGYELAADPRRSLDEIRSAAMHPTPKSPLPTFDEVSWFRQLAHAYLLRRADERRAVPSRMPSPPQ